MLPQDPTWTNQSPNASLQEPRWCHELGISPASSSGRMSFRVHSEELDAPTGHYCQYLLCLLYEIFPALIFVPAVSLRLLKHIEGHSKAVILIV